MLSREQKELLRQSILRYKTPPPSSDVQIGQSQNGYVQPNYFLDSKKIRDRSDRKIHQSLVENKIYFTIPKRAHSRQTTENSTTFFITDRSDKDRSARCFQILFLIQQKSNQQISWSFQKIKSYIIQRKLYIKVCQNGLTQLDYIYQKIISRNFRDFYCQTILLNNKQQQPQNRLCITTERNSMKDSLQGKKLSRQNSISSSYNPQDSQEDDNIEMRQFLLFKSDQYSIYLTPLQTEEAQHLQSFLYTEESIKKSINSKPQQIHEEVEIMRLTDSEFFYDQNLIQQKRKSTPNKRILEFLNDIVTEDQKQEKSRSNTLQRRAQKQIQFKNALFNIFNTDSSDRRLFSAIRKQQNNYEEIKSMTDLNVIRYVNDIDRSPSSQALRRSNSLVEKWKSSQQIDKNKQTYKFKGWVGLFVVILISFIYYII
ncbi:hypothetical protein pb186bvf_012976 [Paramecium bursaria]